MGFDTAPLLIIGFCLAIVVVASLILLRTQWLIQWLKGTAGLLLIALAVYFSLFSLNLFSYQQLSRDEPLATISFRQQGPQSYVATLAGADGNNVDYQLEEISGRSMHGLSAGKAFLPCSDSSPAISLKIFRGVI